MINKNERVISYEEKRYSSLKTKWEGDYTLTLLMNGGFLYLTGKKTFKNNP
jgi:hypothetical protein